MLVLPLGYTHAWCKYLLTADLYVQTSLSGDTFEFSDANAGYVNFHLANTNIIG